ncbi:MAG: hypothetical protein ABIY37_17780 [Devosia sp.]
MKLRKQKATVGLCAAILSLAVPARAELVAENLLTGLPDGFKVGFQTREGGMEMMEFIPAEESVENWSSMITIQVFHGMKNADGDAFASDVAQMWQGGCKDSSTERVEAGTVNGYAAALWHYWCPLNTQTGLPEEMWLEAIRGTDALYVVQYAYRAAATPELEQQALAYLAKASVCDTRIPEQDCPEGM